MNGGTSLRLVDKVHPVLVFPAAVPSSAAPTYVNLALYSHVTFVINGVTGSSGVTAVAVTVNQAQDVSGTGAKALPLATVWQNTDTVAGDTLAATAVASNTFTLSATVSKNVQYILEIDAAELDVANGFGTVQIALANGAAQTVEVTAFLSGSRQGCGVAHFPSAIV